MDSVLNLATYSNIMFSLAVVLGLLLLVYFVLKFWQGAGLRLKSGKAKANHNRVEVIGIQPLDLKRQLALIRFDDQELLVALSDQGCTHLASKTIAKPSAPVQSKVAPSKSGLDESSTHKPSSYQADSPSEPDVPVVSSNTKAMKIPPLVIEKPGVNVFRKGHTLSHQRHTAPESGVDLPTKSSEDISSNIRGNE